MTLKQGYGHQTGYESVDPKQGYNNAKFEMPHLAHCQKKANVKVSVKSKNMLNIS